MSKEDVVAILLNWKLIISTGSRWQLQADRPTKVTWRLAYCGNWSHWLHELHSKNTRDDTLQKTQKNSIPFIKIYMHWVQCSHHLNTIDFLNSTVIIHCTKHTIAFVDTEEPARIVPEKWFSSSTSPLSNSLSRYIFKMYTYWCMSL